MTPYQQGWAAYERGEAQSSNPHTGDDARWWDCGWFGARDVAREAS